MRWERSVGAGVAAAALVAGFGAGLPARAGTDQDGLGARRITLVTGDQVLFDEHVKGSPSVQVKRAKGRERVHFSVRTGDGGDLYVEPDDAQRLIAQGRLDERLFNITLLTKQGYDDAGRKDIPVLAERAQTGKQAALAGTASRASLPSLGIDTMKIDKAKAGATWSALTGNAKVKTMGDNIAKLWLDGRKKALLDRSVPQIGAPAAWKKGLTGKGVTVAVLDTGIDKSHPDLKKVVTKTRGFTAKEAKDVQDKVGHGTHVASTVAGSAAASKGRYKGVSPGAKIAMGKVLGDDGGGYDSWILAGMEWAATKSGAKVVNMSLGTDDAYGIDPVEKAVNTLTAKTGVLFVISAGNKGQGGASTIASPASADAALTVGAVDKKDRLAGFSSRGPRLVDKAVKPDITAPGVGIAAAWAKGTEAEEPVGKYYQRMSGTSMAAPHVAGAAAILAQQHPSWKAPQLKAALIGSAKPGRHGLYEQGAGRVDVARAVAQPIVASEGNIFGYLRWPGPAPQRRDITYTNLSGTPITVKLALPQAPKGLFTLSAGEITLPAKGKASVSLTISAAGVPAGVHTGVLTATAKGVTVRTIIGANVEPRSHDLTAKTIDRAGRPSETWIRAVRLDRPGDEDIIAPGGTGETRLPAGEWLLVGHIATTISDKDSITTVVQPIKLDHDGTEVVLDARKGRQLKTTLDDPTAEPMRNIAAGFVYNDGRTSYDFSEIYPYREREIYITPIHLRGLLFFEQTTWFRTGTTDSPYQYNLVNWSTDGTPENPVFAVKKADLVKIKTSVRGQGKRGVRGGLDVAPIVRLGGGRSLAVIAGSPQADMPATITHYYTPDNRLTWRRGLHTGGQRIWDPDHKTAGLPATEEWNAAVHGPAFVRGSALRTGDTIIYQPQWQYADSAPGRAGYDYWAEGKATLSSGGKVLSTTTLDSQKVLAVKVPAASGKYTLKSSVRRDTPETDLSPKIDTTWTFTSVHTTAEQPLPLKVVRFVPAGLDDLNRAKGRSSTKLAVRVETNPGDLDPVQAAGPTPIIEVSFNDGRTWTKLTVTPANGRFTTTVKNPAKGYVSLRATIPGVLSQTIMHAYAIGR